MVDALVAIFWATVIWLLFFESSWPWDWQGKPKKRNDPTGRRY
jgi:hypothetical protein